MRDLEVVMDGEPRALAQVPDLGFAVPAQWEEATMRPGDGARGVVHPAARRSCGGPETGGSEGAQPPASLRRGLTECGPKEYAGSPALRASDKPIADGFASRRRPSSMRRRPPPQTLRGIRATGLAKRGWGRDGAPRCRAVDVPLKPVRQLIPPTPAPMDTGVISALGWFNLTTLLLRRFASHWSCCPSRLGRYFYGLHPKRVSIQPSG